MNINKKVASKIKENRAQRGYSSDYVASQLKISRSAYSQLENGKVEITFNRIEAIAAVLETPLSDFFPDDKGNIVINNDQSTGFIGNQINHYSDENLVKQMQETINALQHLLSKVK